MIVEASTVHRHPLMQLPCWLKENCRSYLSQVLLLQHRGFYGIGVEFRRHHIRGSRWISFNGFRKEIISYVKAFSEIPHKSEWAWAGAEGVVDEGMFEASYCLTSELGLTQN